MNKLLQFTVANYRSFKDPVTFSMAASSIKDNPTESVFVCNRKKLLTLSAVYGANSSGKSNLALAIRAMKQFVVSNVKLNDSDIHENFCPFMLNKTSIKLPTHFEIVFFMEDIGRVRYGFEYDLFSVNSEWLSVLYEKNSGKEETSLFSRNHDEIWVNEESFAEGIDLESKTNDNRLFLSVVSQLGGELSKRIMSFFHNDLTVISGIYSADYRDLTRLSFLHKDKISERALAFFHHIKLGFNDIKIEERQGVSGLNDANKEYIPAWKRWNVFTLHNTYDEYGNPEDVMPFNMESLESDGTQKIYEMSASIFNALEKGSILVIDELDAKMHPLISQEILKLFTDKDNNPHHAQLVFTTHDTNLLSAGLLRRDEIWLTEKNAVESTDLYRLMDVQFADGTRPRNDANLERNYIRGRYGAIPFITYSDYGSEE